MLNTDGANRLSVLAIVVVHVRIATIEVQVVSIGIPIRNTGPIVAVRTHIVETTIIAVARKREEKSNLPTIH